MANYCKYYKEQQYVSFDSGVTWSATSETRKGDLIEINSVDCGYVPPLAMYREVSGATYCRQTDQVRDVDYQVSYDEGETWQTIGTSVVIIERNCPACGYVPPAPTPCTPMQREYEFNTLDTMVYLLGEHSTDINIDGEDAYIEGLSGTPLGLRVYDVSLEEEDSLDERYSFTKTVKFKVHGFADKSILEDKYYIVIKDVNGIQWLVNVDFPSDVTYTFNLGRNVSETEFTFKSLSNHPTLRLVSEIGDAIDVCYGYHSNGVKTLEILESNLCKLDRQTKTVYVQDGEEFQNVKYNKNSFSLQESYDGDYMTTKIEFSLPWNNAWYYTMLQFPTNKYSCIVKTDNDENTYFCGFNFGLQPSYKVTASSKKGESNYVTITLIETSALGIEALDDWSQEDKSLYTWTYPRATEQYPQCWECDGNGIAKLLVMEEVNGFGTPTGRYKVLDGYVSQFPLLNIVGTFSEIRTFEEPSCRTVGCDANGTMPASIEFNEQTCYTYTLSASCAWEITNKPSWIGINPSNGSPNVNYTVTVCSTLAPTDTDKTGLISMKIGNIGRLISVALKQLKSGLYPNPQSINCLSQTVRFNYNPLRKPTITNMPSGLTYTWGDGYLNITVPRNETLTARTWTFEAISPQTMNTQIVNIYQDKTYENWVVVDGSVICEGNTSYQKLRRYTGLTQSTTTAPTNEYKKGSIISTGDTACGVAYKVVWGEPHCNEYYEYVQEYTQYVSYNYGTTWEVASTGYNVLERNSERCGYTPPTAGTKVALGYDGEQVGVQCVGSGALTSGDTHPEGKQITDLISAVVGDCVTSVDDYTFSGASSLYGVLWMEGRNITSIGRSAFNGCTNLTNFSIPSGLTSVGAGAFYGCESLSRITIPSGLGILNTGVFEYCTSLTSVTIPSSVTEIGISAFAYCSGLTEVTIGSGVTEIKYGAFESCTSLESITIRATTPPTIGIEVFDDTNDCPIYVPSGSVQAYKTAWSEYASRIYADS